MSADVFTPERIVGHRTGKGGVPEVLVKWAGFPDADNTWEPASNIRIVVSDVVTRPPSFGPVNLAKFVQHRFEHKDDVDDDFSDDDDTTRSMSPPKAKTATTPPSSNKARRKAGPSNNKKSSRFRGVSWSKSDLKWKSYIYVGGKQVAMGSFHDEEAAAFAHDEGMRRYRGPNPAVNFPVAGSGERLAVKCGRK